MLQRQLCTIRPTTFLLGRVESFFPSSGCLRGVTENTFYLCIIYLSYSISVLNAKASYKSKNRAKSSTKWHSTARKGKMRFAILCVLLFNLLGSLFPSERGIIHPNLFKWDQRWRPDRGSWSRKHHQPQPASSAVSNSVTVSPESWVEGRAIQLTLCGVFENATRASAESKMERDNPFAWNSGSGKSFFERRRLFPSKKKFSIINQNRNNKSGTSSVALSSPTWLAVRFLRWFCINDGSRGEVVECLSIESQILYWDYKFIIYILYLFVYFW